MPWFFRHALNYLFYSQWPMTGCKFEGKPHLTLFDTKGNRYSCRIVITINMTQPITASEFKCGLNKHSQSDNCQSDVIIEENRNQGFEKQRASAGGFARNRTPLRISNLFTCSAFVPNEKLWMSPQQFLRQNGILEKTHGKSSSACGAMTLLRFDQVQLAFFMSIKI